MPKAKTTAARKKRSPSSFTPRQSILAKSIHWMKRHWWQFALVLLVLMAVYSVVLDAQIQHKFGGNKWQVPAQVFARPLVLSVGREMTSKELIDELQLLAYRPVTQLQQSGDYVSNYNMVSLVRRAFDFPEHPEEERSIQVVFANGKVQHIRDLISNDELDSVSLEPWLVTRLLSAEREDRMLVNLEEVPSALVDTLLLVEDKDFYDHHGVVPLSILRALVANIKAGARVQGGSTLTQQLVKNFFLTREKSIIRKVREAWISLLIELRYSKEDILQAYLNEVFLGQNGATGVHGFGLASHFYFDRPLPELNLAEMATLVAMVKGPSYYNPRRYPKRVIERRDTVLRLLFENNVLSKAEYQHWLNTPLTLANENRLAQGKYPSYMDQVKRELRQALASPELFQSGIKVFTAMDPLAQRRAEVAVRRGIPKLEKLKKVQELQGAMLVSDIRSGEIRAIVGGKDPQYHGFNRALDAKRPIGSIIKPAVYLTALEQADQYNLASIIADKPIQMKSSHGQLWKPLNADKKFRGEVNLITALTRSLNVPTVNLGMQVGLDNVANTLQRMGVDDEVSRYPAMTLGAVNLSPFQVNQMYQTIANEGQYIPLHALRAVTTVDDSLLWQFEKAGQQRLDPKATYLVNYALHKVTREGTARVLKELFPQVNMAGKTGTTDDYRDSWFSGYDRYALSTIWVGKDNNQITKLTGAGGALDLYVNYQQSQQPKSLVRSMPEGVNMVHFDQKSGQYLATACPQSLILPAVIDALPPSAANCVQSPVKSEQKKKSLWQRLFGD
ncbi:penicillin-binding protein 1B [Alteromonadaceae bacterium BrNp21-10]|nr:penicillin-binding protein 1B [Alteromonadaceae bacterium BrNp21-10]